MWQNISHWGNQVRNVQENGLTFEPVQNKRLHKNLGLWACLPRPILVKTAVRPALVSAPSLAVPLCPSGTTMLASETRLGRIRPKALGNCQVGPTKPHSRKLFIKSTDCLRGKNLGKHLLHMNLNFYKTGHLRITCAGQGTEMTWDMQEGARCEGRRQCEPSTATSHKSTVGPRPRAQFHTALTCEGLAQKRTRSGTPQ